MANLNRTSVWLRNTVIALVVLAATAIGLLVRSNYLTNATDALGTRPVEQQVTGDARTSRSFIRRTLTGGQDAPLESVIQRIDPAVDREWKSEVLAEDASRQLARLTKLLSKPALLTLGQIAEISDASVTCTSLRPDNLREVFSDGSVTVWQAPFASRGGGGGGGGGGTGTATSKPSMSKPASSLPPNSKPSYVGHAGLAEALRDLLQPYHNTAEIRTKCKVVSIDVHPDYFATTIDFQSDGQFTDASNQAYLRQQNAEWTGRWKSSTDTGPPKLVGLVLNRFEEVHASPERGIRFADRTLRVMQRSGAYLAQLSRGVDFWRSRLESDYGVDSNGNQGIALGDIDGDGLEDVYICQQGGMPNRMLARNADGTLRDVSADAGVDWLEPTRSALFVDLDNDGDQDLVICQGWHLLFMLNSGAGEFELSARHRCRGDAYSMAAADYDQDGDIDIFVCGRDRAPGDGEQAPGILGMPVPYHDANNGAANMLWQNDGAGAMREVADQVGLDQNNRRFSYAAAWADYDNDGDMDLYVANDFGRNNLYENNDGHFTDRAAELGVEDVSAGMSATWGDYDADGRLDLYVSNMFSSAGNRIAYQRSFRSGSSEQTLNEFRRHARGNTLFRNVGNVRDGGTGFEDVSLANGVTMGRWAWGSKFVDLNNDSREDLYVANGFISTEDTGDL